MAYTQVMGFKDKLKDFFQGADPSIKPSSAVEEPEFFSNDDLEELIDKIDKFSGLEYKDRGHIVNIGDQVVMFRHGYQGWGGGGEKYGISWAGGPLDFHVTRPAHDNKKNYPYKIEVDNPAEKYGVYHGEAELSVRDSVISFTNASGIFAEEPAAMLDEVHRVIGALIENREQILERCAEIDREHKVKRQAEWEEQNRQNEEKKQEKRAELLSALKDLPKQEAAEQSQDIDGPTLN